MPGRSTAPTRLRRAWQEVGPLGGRSLISAGAVVSVCALAAPVPLPVTLIGALLGLASLIALVVRRWSQLRRPTGDSLLGYFVSVRALLLIAVGETGRLRNPSDGWIWLAVGLTVIMVVLEPLVAILVRTPTMAYARVPGISPTPKLRPAPGWVCVASLLIIAVGAVLAAVGLPGWILLIPVLAAAALLALIVARAVRRNLITKHATKAIPSALATTRPAFAVYYATVVGASYQLGMWLPYLERLGQPFVVITRHPATVPVIRKLTKAPVVSPPPGQPVARWLEQMVSPSMRAAFYVQGSSANQAFQRFTRLTHVWLNHGDSDKLASYHPRHASYDRLLLSGRQAMDRYAAHGIDIPAEKFVLIGRPQIDRVLVRDQLPGPEQSRTILYAPTWKGGRPRSNYSSLPVAEPIIRALLDRGVTVIFRPHPLSYQDHTDTSRITTIHRLLADDQQRNGRSHAWGKAAETAMDLPACFNAADGLVTDVSSVASEFLASGKPFAMVAVQLSGDAFRTEFPSARVAYLIESDPTLLDQSLTESLDHLLASDPADDPLAEPRLDYRRYCLGDHVGAEAAEPFLRAAREIVTGRSS